MDRKQKYGRFSICAVKKDAGKRRLIAKLWLSQYKEIGDV